MSFYDTSLIFIHRYITDIRLPYFLTVFLHPTGFILTQVFCYLIMIVREIGRNSIIEITYMVFPAYSQFKTAVRNLGRIHGRRSLNTHCQVKVRSCQDTIRYLIIYVQLSCQTIIEKTGIHTKVRNSRAFPFQTRVTDPVLCQSSSLSPSKRIIISLISSLITVIVLVTILICNAVVTYLSPGSTDFQVR